jgi:hypothetical protein
VTQAVRAGALYALSAFALGFLLALVRIPILVPAIGETPAVLVELPIMLAACWAICRAILRRTAVPAGSRLLMGAVFLALLLAAELALGLALGGTTSGTLHDRITMPGILGLASQALSALFPSLQAAR